MRQSLEGALTRYAKKYLVDIECRRYQEYYSTGTKNIIALD